MLQKLRDILNHPLADLSIGLMSIMVIATACAWILLDAWGQHHGHRALSLDTNLAYMGGTVVAAFVGRLSKHYHKPGAGEPKAFIQTKLEVPATVVTVHDEAEDQNTFSAV